MRGTLLFFFLTCVLLSEILPVNIVPSGEKQDLPGIRILDQKVLSYATVGGEPFSEISDLAYDKQSEKLYMVSDEGRLFVFRARFGNKIEQLHPLDGVMLTKRGGKSFRRWRNDSEGMTLDGKRRLLISFEGKAKIGWFHKNSAKIGQRIRKYPLPRCLRNPSHYRSRNKSLEALAWHPRFGILTAAEWPLKRDPKKCQTVYALNGKRWHFRAEEEAKSAVCAIEVMDDGNLLVLERAYSSLFNPLVVTLKKVYLNHPEKGWCRTEILAKMSTHRGWNIDNFEGLTRVGKNRYLMVSDDNGNFFQRTILVYFEVKR